MISRANAHATCGSYSELLCIVTTVLSNIYKKASSAKIHEKGSQGRQAKADRRSSPTLILSSYNHKRVFSVLLLKINSFLIDLDLAKRINISSKNDPACSAPRRRTGTMLFMAIGALEGSAPHTWRHDLESFFYVLIWLCVTAANDSDPRDCKELCDAWSAKGAATMKLAQMSDDIQFLKLLDLFAPSIAGLGLTELVEKLRNILFPVLSEGRGVCRGTPPDRTRVYEAVIEQIDDFIGTLNVE